MLINLEKKTCIYSDSLYTCIWN